MAQDNQYGFFRDVQLNNGALVVTGITGGGESGTSGTSGAAGTSGTNGTSGAAGTSGTNGTSGTSGGGGGATRGIHFNTTQVAGKIGMLSITSNSSQVACNGFENRIIAYPVIPVVNTPISAVTIDQGGVGVGAQGKLLLYSDLNNYPDSLLKESSVLDLSVGGIKNYTFSNYILSAGTQYWIGIGFNNSNLGNVGLYAYYPAGLLSIGRPEVSDGYGTNYKVAVSETLTWSTIPSTFVNGGTVGFYDSYIVNGYYGGTGLLPAIYVKFSS